MKKRILSIILILSICLGLLPVAVSAADDEVRYSADGGVTWMEASLMDAIWACYSESNVQIELLRDITLDSGWYAQQDLGYNGSTWTLDGKGYTIKRTQGAKMLFCVRYGCTVTIKDITIDGGAIWEGDDPADRTNTGLSLEGKNAHLIYVDGGATLILENGTTLQNSDLGNSSYGAAIVVGGSDEGNGKLIMKDGVTIKDNRAASGGAICIMDSGDVFDVQGGIISGNFANVGGGAVMNDGGTFTMTGGEISDNASGNNGGGITVNNAFTMSGGSITGNKSTLGGGGVTILAGTVKLTGGSITDNTITGTLGGGLLVNGGSLTVSGNPVVTGNTSGSSANNVYLSSGKTITVSDALGTGALLGVTTKTAPADGTPVNVTGTNNADYSSYFSSDAGYSVAYNENVVQLTSTRASAPGLPQNLIAAVENGDDIKLTWEAPADNGGSAVTGYEVSCDDGGSWVTVTGSTSYTATGLAPGQTHTFQVRAVNAAGKSESASATADLPAIAPGLPQNLTAAAGDGIVTLTWNPPASDGGSEITEYKVSSDGQTWISVTGISYTVSGLTNGTSYTFMVKAVNDVGEGETTSVTASPAAPVPSTPDSDPKDDDAPLVDNDEDDDDYTPSTPSTESVTVPISGEENTIQVDASVSGTTATIDEVGLSHLDTVIGEEVQTGTVTIDFSVLDTSEPITTVELPAAVIEQIAEAVSDPGNDAESLEIVFSDGTSIEFDAEALGEKAAQADGLDITISIERHEDAKLTDAQKNAVGDRPAYDINVTSGGKPISDMGGRITIHAPYELKPGEKPHGVVVWYIDDAGNRERCATSYDPVKKRVNWKTDHLSLYMIDHQEPSGWVETADGWVYYNTDGTLITGWLKSGGKWYYLDGNGVMVTGWLWDDSYDAWFYLTESGAMKTGWFWDSDYNAWFYLNPNGTMKIGWHYGADSKWYFLGQNGIMKTGWLWDKSYGAWYYLSIPNGDMLVNTTTPDGYTIGGDGKWIP